MKCRAAILPAEDYSVDRRRDRSSDDFVGHFGIFIVPGPILGTCLAASTMRMPRAMMLEVLRQESIRSAWAKGLRERLVILRHVIKNALIPVVTLVGLQIPIIVGGAVIMEQMFAIPGLGRLMIDSCSIATFDIDREGRRAFERQGRARLDAGAGEISGNPDRDGHFTASAQWTLLVRIRRITEPVTNEVVHQHRDDHENAGKEHPGLL